MLLDKGVSLNKTDENGCTPLHYAALTHQQYDLAKFFIGNYLTYLQLANYFFSFYLHLFN